MKREKNEIITIYHGQNDNDVEFHEHSALTEYFTTV